MGTISVRGSRFQPRALGGDIKSGTAIIGALALVGCDRQRAIDIPSGPIAPPAAEAAGQVAGPTSEMSGEQGLAYIVTHAQALVRSWRPLAFTGDLAPYSDDFANTRANQLIDDACAGSQVRRDVKSFHDQMGEVPSAVATSGGPVIYEGYWDRAGDRDRLILLGVRVRDRGCAGLDLNQGHLHADGDADIAAVLLVVASLRQTSIEDEHSPLSPSVRNKALTQVASLAGAGGTPAQSDGPHIYSASAFRALLAGRSKKDVVALLGRPLAVHDGISAGEQTYDYSSDETYLGRVGFLVTDDATGQVLRSVTVAFAATGTVEGIRF